MVFESCIGLAPISSFLAFCCCCQLKNIPQRYQVTSTLDVKRHGQTEDLEIISDCTGELLMQTEVSL